MSGCHSKEGAEWAFVIQVDREGLLSKTSERRHERAKSSRALRLVIWNQFSILQVVVAGEVFTVAR
jgi:hypothetical protein